MALDGVTEDEIHAGSFT